MDHKLIGHIIHESPISDSEVKVISDRSGKVTIEAILQDCDVDNRNGRYYASKDLLPEIKSDRVQELIRTKNFKGENGHPMSKELNRQQIIEPKYVCCRYTKLWNDGKDIKALVVGTNNEYGREFNEDILEGQLPSFSLRALGTIEQVGAKAMVKNIKIITWDRVIYPSHKRAYMEKIVTESGCVAEDGNKNKLVVEENYSGSIIPITNQNIINFIKTESCNIKSILENFDTLYESINVVDSGRNVQLLDRFGNVMIVALENHISREIRDYCTNNR